MRLHRLTRGAHIHTNASQTSHLSAGARQPSEGGSDPVTTEGVRGTMTGDREGRRRIRLKQRQRKKGMKRRGKEGTSQLNKMR